MDIKELQPIIDLMNMQEERLVRKIDEVHGDVVTTRDQAIKTNGRVTEAEKDIIQLKNASESRKLDCGKKLADLTPTIQTVRTINLITKKPKVSISIFIGVLICIQTLIYQAVENNWIREIINYLKP